MKKMLEKRLAQLSGESVSQPLVTVSEEAQEDRAIEVAKQHSGKDIILWLLAIACLIGATLVNPYLPAYWQPASNIWVRIGIIVALAIIALGALAFTHQGSAFKTLLADSLVELRRITWPTKQETGHFTWQVLVVTAILTALVWVLDTIFAQLISYILASK